MFIVNTTSNNKVYTRAYQSYMDAWLYAGQLPHHLSTDGTIEIHDNAADKVCAKFDKLAGWGFGQPVLNP